MLFFYMDTSKKILLLFMMLFFMKTNTIYRAIMVLKIYISVDLDRDNDEKMDKYVKDAPQPIDDQSTHATLANDEQRSQYIRKRLAWMSDYEKTRIDQSNNPLTHFMLFLYRDPMTFKDVVRESK